MMRLRLALLLCLCGCPRGGNDSNLPAGEGQVGPNDGAPQSAPASPTIDADPEQGNTTAPPASPSAGDGNAAAAVPPPAGATKAAKPVAFPALQFISNPSGTDPNAMVLSFDDGPDGMDGGQTAYILDQLKALKVKASFYVCGHVYTDVLTDPQGQRDIQRIVAEGHTLGSHTMRHPHLGDANTKVVAEMADNQNMVWSPLVLGPAVPAMATYRAPFGDPFQTNVTATVTRVAPLTQPYGVHVGWSITSGDVDCAALANPNATCIVNSIKASLNKGRRGVILMHSVYRITGDALPAIVAECQRRGLHFVTADQLIEAKYGATPEAIMAANKAAGFTPAQIAAEALNQGKLNNDVGTAP